MTTMCHVASGPRTVLDEVGARADRESAGRPHSTLALAAPHFLPAED
jgi:hypothetical protein